MDYKLKQFRFFKFDFYENMAVTTAFVVFGYTCFRAGLLSITHDESLTYFLYVRSSLKDILSYSGEITSNNHLLNTLLMKLSVAFFGNSEFVLRIPALIGHLLYLVGTFQILRLFLNRTKLALGFGLMATNPFLLDFFSCARGYSLGLGFITLGLYYFFRRLESSDSSFRTRNKILALIMLTLSVLSNLSFIYVYAPVAGILIMVEIKDALTVAHCSRKAFTKQINKRVIMPLFFSAFCLSLIYNPVTFVKIRNYVANYGSTEGFWAGTITSLLQSVFYGKDYGTSQAILLVRIFIIMVIGLSAFIFLALFFKKNLSMKIHKYLWPMVVILFFAAISMYIQFAIFGVLYPIDRAAIYLIPLFLIMFLVLWEYSNTLRNNYVKTITSGLFYAATIAMLLHNLLCLNITHYYIWKYDASTKKAMKKVYDLTSSETNRKYRMGINWVFEPSTNYYILKNQMFWMEWTHRGGPDDIYDYYYLREEDKRIARKYHLKQIESYLLPGTYLAVP